MAGKPSFLRRLVGGLWRTLALIYSLIFLFILIAVPVAIYLVVHQPAPPVPSKAVLVVDPVGNLVEQHNSGVGSLVENVLPDQGQPSVVRDLITALDRARNDNRIKEVLLKLNDLAGAAPGQVQDLIAAIDRFKQSGKPVIAWSDAYDETQYELASHADRIEVGPLGYVLLTGYGAYRTYYKDALDKLGVDINVFRVGKYKSYVEPYTRNSMSPAAKSDNLKWMNSLWQTYKKTVTAGRDVTPSDIDQYISNYASNLVARGGDASALAKKAGLVDQIGTWRDLRKPLIKKVGRDPDTGSFNQINQDDYLADTHAKATASDSTLAMVTVSGDIVNGESVPGSAGGETISRLIDDARRNDQVAGLVLRVNSPGGSVTAAEHIRRSVMAFRRAGKPVVVSMAGMAASGGYWVSMNANQIWAEPSTVTGSIGIFAIVPTFSKTLDKLGIHSDGVGTTKLSGAMQLEQPLSQPAQMILQAGVKHGYNQFIGHVADARHMSRAAVNKIAQGKVWSGAQAKQIGLVDKLGDLTGAEAAAARLAGLKPDHYHLRPMQPPAGWRAAIEQLLGSHITASLVPSWLTAPTHTDAVDFLRSLNDPHDLYARCFCRIQSADTLAGAARARHTLQAP